MAASDFSEIDHQYSATSTLPLPPWKEDLARFIASDLFGKFYEHHPYSHLRILELRFARLEISDGAQAKAVYNSVFVRRLKRDDAPRPEDGGFTVECEHKWPTEEES